MTSRPISASKGYRKFATLDGSYGLVLQTLSGKRAPTRPLTAEERLLAAVWTDRPTHHLTLTSRSLTYQECTLGLNRFFKRMGRARGKEFIYVAVPASKKTGAAGYHVHLLLWEYIHAPVLHHHGRACGFDGAHIDQISVRDTVGWYRAAGYALAQVSPVFGSVKHVDNHPRPKFKRQYLLPQRKTLIKRKPNLFSAIQLAQNKAVSDRDLLLRLPRFNTYRGCQGCPACQPVSL